MVTGIVLGKSCRLPKMAGKIPGEIHPDSQVKRMSRWMQKEAITFARYFLPFVQPLLRNLAKARPPVFIMGSSAVGRGGVTLMVT